MAPLGAAERPRAPTRAELLSRAGDGARPIVNSTGRCTVVHHDGEYWMNAEAGGARMVTVSAASDGADAWAVAERDGLCEAAQWSSGSDVVRVFDATGEVARQEAVGQFAASLRSARSTRRLYREMVAQGHVVIVIEDSTEARDGDSGAPATSGRARDVWGAARADALVDAIMSAVGPGQEVGLVSGWPLGASSSSRPLWWVVGGSGRWMAVSPGGVR